MAQAPPSPTLAPFSTTNPVEILLVEDDDADALLLERRLARCGSVRVTRCTTVAGACESLAKGHFDVILLDLGLPDAVGVEGIGRVAESGLSTPTIVLTGLDDEDTAIEAVRCGAQDYMVKGQLEPRVMWSSIRHAIERHRLSDQLRIARARELEVKDRVLSHVSHELRTPLTAVSQFVGILRDGLAGELNAKQVEYLEIVDRNVVQLKRMIGDLMDVARIGGGKMSLDVGLIDVGDCVAEALDAVAATAVKKRIELSSHLPAGSPRVLADRSRVTQVLVNLVGNAVKFSPESSQVLVKVEVESADALRVTVQDHGCGISPEGVEQIFERLHQEGNGAEGSRKGLGLGLYITREIVEYMQGRIWVESEPGQGSKFHFTLPVYTLEALVRRVLGEHGSPSLALAVVQLTTREGRTPARAQDSAVREVVRGLESCLMLPSDAVLPETRQSGASSWVFALAMTDQRGAEAIEGRLRSSLETQWSRLHSWGYAVQVKCEMIAGFDGGEGAARAAELVAARMDEIGSA